MTEPDDSVSMAPSDFGMVEETIPPELPNNYVAAIMEEGGVLPLYEAESSVLSDDVSTFIQGAIVGDSGVAAAVASGLTSDDVATAVKGAAAADGGLIPARLLGFGPTDGAIDGSVSGSVSLAPDPTLDVNGVVDAGNQALQDVSDYSTDAAGKIVGAVNSLQAPVAIPPAGAGVSSAGSAPLTSVPTPTETIVPNGPGSIADADAESVEGYGSVDAATLDPGGDFTSGLYGDISGDVTGDIGDVESDVQAGGDSLLGDIASSGVPLAAVGGAAYDIADGNYDGAIAEGVIGGADIAGEALGLPGFDSDVNVVTDLIDGNTGALEGDAETAGIETATSLVGAALGSVIGPEGTVAGAAIGNFVGGAIAPAVEDVVGDTVTNAEDVGSDTYQAFSRAGSDISDGNVAAAVGDLATGAAEDVGDVASEAVDLTGDALEGVGDVVTSTAGLVGDVGEGLEDAADGVDDVVDDIGDGIDDLESLF